MSGKGSCLNVTSNGDLWPRNALDRTPTVNGDIWITSSRTDPGWRLRFWVGSGSRGINPVVGHVRRVWEVWIPRRRKWRRIVMMCWGRLYFRWKGEWRRRWGNGDGTEHCLAGGHAIMLRMSGRDSSFRTGMLEQLSRLVYPFRCWSIHCCLESDRQSIT